MAQLRIVQGSEEAAVQAYQQTAFPFVAVSGLEKIELLHLEIGLFQSETYAEAKSAWDKLGPFQKRVVIRSQCEHIQDYVKLMQERISAIYAYITEARNKKEIHKKQVPVEVALEIVPRLFALKYGESLDARILFWNSIPADRQWDLLELEKKNCQTEAAFMLRRKSLVSRLITVGVCLETLSLFPRLDSREVGGFLNA